jgi:hypothetical protein
MQRAPAVLIAVAATIFGCAETRSAAKDVGHTAKEGGKEVGKAGKDVGKKVGQAGKDTGKAVKKAVKGE